MSDLDDFKATYFDECSELLLELEEQFAAIEDGDRSSDRLNAVFRAIHSIKGGGGAFGFQSLVGFAHAYETLLDHVRDGRVELSEQTTALCIRSNDIVADFIAAARDGAELAADYGADEKAQFDALTRGDVPEGEEGGEHIEEFDIDFTPVMVKIADDVEPVAADGDDAFAASPLVVEPGHWEIKFTPHSELYARANDPLLLFRELAALGQIQVRAVFEDVPPLADFEPFGVYCSWEISLHSPTVTEAAIAEVFEFVDGNCDLSIAQLTTMATAAADSTAAADLVAPAEDAEPSPSFADLAASIAPPPRPVQVAAAPKAPALKAVASDDDHGDDRRAGPDDRRNGVQSIRVDLDKIDRVVNMVGELVITQSMLTQQMDEVLRARYQELVRGLEVLAQTTRGLQDSVMAIRAQPVKSVFSRMPRLMRELATKTGKKIKLETIGENTEIDKTIIEQLSDPLTHMIRNSADHGIESPEKRRAAGKNETGTIRLSAEQAGGNILIIVEDDGAGINRDRVLQVARDRMVVGPDQQLTEEQIDQLIFAPGFSTASEVSDISGRGVGMDVVKRSIQALGGRISISSRPGHGSTFTMSLPLTLAVLDGMVVTVAGQTLVVPLTAIVETLQPEAKNIHSFGSNQRLISIRNSFCPLVDVGRVLNFRPTQADPVEGVALLVESEGGGQRALMVDAIQGQRQVVIKSLEANYTHVPGIAAATILGDGRVALILDVDAIVSASRGQPLKQEMSLAATG